MNLDLAKFCDDEASRYDLGLPWKLSDGRIAATDGRILIVVSDSLYCGPRHDEGRHPKEESLAFCLAYDGEFSEFPKFYRAAFEDGRWAVAFADHWFRMSYVNKFIRWNGGLFKMRWGVKKHEGGACLIVDFDLGRISLMEVDLEEQPK